MVGLSHGRGLSPTARKGRTMATATQRAQRLSGALWALGYPTELHGDHWQVYGPGWNGPRVGTIREGELTEWTGPARGYHAAQARA